MSDDDDCFHFVVIILMVSSSSLPFLWFWYIPPLLLLTVVVHIMKSRFVNPLQILWTLNVDQIRFFYGLCFMLLFRCHKAVGGPHIWSGLNELVVVVESELPSRLTEGMWCSGGVGRRMLSSSPCADWHVCFSLERQTPCALGLFCNC